MESINSKVVQMDRILKASYYEHSKAHVEYCKFMNPNSKEVVEIKNKIEEIVKKLTKN